jgi:RNA polymerase sigma-70 factor (ECF subfamily)
MPDPMLEALLAERAWVQRIARSLVSDAHRAEDVAQAAFTSALERPPHHALNLRSWLTTLVRNTARSMYRGQRRRTAREDAWIRAQQREELRTDDADQPDRAIERAELVREIVNAVLALREPYRTAIVLAYFEDLSPSEIAKRLTIPSSTVRSHIKRGLDLVRAELDGSHRTGRLQDRERWISALISIAREPSRGAVVSPKHPLGTSASIPGASLVAMNTKLIVAAAVVALSIGVWFSRRSSASDPRRAATIVASSDPVELQGSAGATDARVPISPPAQAANADSRASALDGSLRVEVTWQKDGSPASGVGVLIRQWDGASRSTDRELVTDREGVASMEHLSARHTMIYVDRGGWTRADVELGQCTAARVAIPVGVRVRGIVVDPEFKPVADAAIEVSYSPDVTLANVVTRSGVDGRFEVESIEQMHHVGASKAGWASSSTCMVRPQSDRPMEMKLVLVGPAVQLRGIVLDSESKPVAGAAVLVGAIRRHTETHIGHEQAYSATPRRAVTNADGRFAIDSIPIGKNDVTVDANGFARRALNVDVHSNDDSSVEIRMSRGSLLHGVVQDKQGLPVANARVEIHRSSAGITGSAKTDANGAYHIDGVPAGTHRVLADADTRGRVRATIEAREGVDVAWNATIDQGLVLSGRVVDESDQPLRDWLVWTQPSAVVFSEAQWNAMIDWPTNWGQTKTDAEGRFLLCNVLDYDCKIEVRRPMQHSSIPVVEVENLKPGTRDILIRVGTRDEPSAYMRGFIVDENGQPVGGATVRLVKQPMLTWSASSSATSHETSGGFKIGPVPAGRYELVVIADGFAEPKLDHHWSLERDTEDNVGEIHLKSAGSVCATLTRRDGPVGSVNVWIRGSEQFQEPLAVFGNRARSGVLAPGKYRLEVRGTNGAVLCTSASFTIESGKQTDVELELPREQR